MTLDRKDYQQLNFWLRRAEYRAFRDACRKLGIRQSDILKRAARRTIKRVEAKP